MILSVSRRTDIPAFYSEWFMNRIREGYVLVRNPMNYHQISKISLDPGIIDCIVLWTKNAEPMMQFIDELAEHYVFYFQYTLNAYDRGLEKNVPPFDKRIDTFIHLSERIDAKRIVWRYDPILMTDSINSAWHINQFQKIAEKLEGYTHTCVFSFIDMYEKMRINLRGSSVRSCNIAEMKELAVAFSSVAVQHGMLLQTCAEEIDLDAYGIKHGCCIDGTLISQLAGYEISAKKDKNQRAICGCLESVDIGQYNTCRHGCRYCYANFNEQSVVSFSNQHDPCSPLLVGNTKVEDKITIRQMKSLRSSKDIQLSMF